MTLIETSIFSQIIKKLMNDDEYRNLQIALVQNPQTGKLIPGGGGLRKIRWTSVERQKGKRSGIRVIYYIQSMSCLYMIFAYDKNRQKDLTREQLKALRAYVKGEVL